MPIIDRSAADAEALVREYDEFVSQSPHGHMMQSPRWASVKANWNSDLVYLRDNGKISAAMSIVSISNDGGESSFMYAPRGPVCDIWDTDLVRRLIAEAEPAFKERKGFLLRIDPEVDYTGELADTIRAANFNSGSFVLRTPEETDMHAFSNPPLNMVADLTGKDADTLIDTYPSKTRGKIRKPFKSGLVTRAVRITDPDFEAALDEFYRLTGIMAERQGITYRPKEYFVRLMNAYPQSRLYLTEHVESGTVLASSIVVGYNRKAFYMYSASSNEMRNFRASDQMNFVAMQDSIRDGRSEYDMGGIFTTDIDDGLYNFKRQFCGEQGLRRMIGELDLVFDESKYQEFVN